LTLEEYERCFLSDDISNEVDRLAEEVDQFFDKGEYQKAIQIYQKGIEIIPKPKNIWKAKLWFTAAVIEFVSLSGGRKRKPIYQINERTSTL
jgi:tetratricopeptide (TPR) repeat protein